MFLQRKIFFSSFLHQALRLLRFYFCRNVSCIENHSFQISLKTTLTTYIKIPRFYHHVGRLTYLLFKNQVQFVKTNTNAQVLLNARGNDSY